MTPGTYNFPNHRRGDTFNGHTFEISQNGDPVDFTDAEILIQFRASPISNVVLEWSTEDGITISGAENNVINMASKTGEEMDIPAGTYKYDIQVVLSNGVTNTYVKGSMKIINDISR